MFFSRFEHIAALPAIGGWWDDEDDQVTRCPDSIADVSNYAWHGVEELLVGQLAPELQHKPIQGVGLCQIGARG